MCCIIWLIYRVYITIDLDGDGIETVSQNAGIVFDTDADGLKTGTSWLKGDDGWLVLDKNNNGKMPSKNGHSHLRLCSQKTVAAKDNHL